jgi:hypothetical protein
LKVVALMAGLKSRPNKAETVWPKKAETVWPKKAEAVWPNKAETNWIQQSEAGFRVVDKRRACGAGSLGQFTLGESQFDAVARGFVMSEIVSGIVSELAPSPLRRTALHATHHSHKAKMVDFGGWDMPVQYAGLVAEHMAVRTGVGIFDVSHMGDIQLRGPNSLAAVQKLLMNDASKLQIGQAHYSAMLYPNGTFVDDVILLFDRDQCGDAGEGCEVGSLCDRRDERRACDRRERLLHADRDPGAEGRGDAAEVDASRPEAD